MNNILVRNAKNNEIYKLLLMKACMTSNNLVIVMI